MNNSATPADSNSDHYGDHYGSHNGDHNGDHYTDQDTDLSSYQQNDDNPDAAAGEDEIWSYEVPRPWLSVEEAANMLGRSVRGVERSIIGRWGNKLPEGWQARRVRLDGKDEWRIVPPPGFRVKHSKKMDPATRAALARLEHARLEDEKCWDKAHPESNEDDDQEHNPEHNAKHNPKHNQEQSFRRRSPSDSAAVAEALEHTYMSSGASSLDNLKDQPNYDYLHEDKDVPSKTADGQSGFSLEKLFHSASQMAQKELASLGLNVKNQLMVDSQNYANSLDVEHTIVIDRSDEVEKLLRELANVQKELSEERRQHMEDMRLINQMQNNMRLLEVNATQTSELKEDLQMAQKLLLEHKKQYQAYLALPWWKKIFKSQP